MTALVLVGIGPSDLNCSAEEFAGPNEHEWTLLYSLPTLTSCLSHTSVRSFPSPRRSELNCLRVPSYQPWP